MKGRIRLNSLPTENQISELARVSRPDVAAVAATRLFARRQIRYRGQALLLAVLIMLLAALLSAGFLAVVSGNLNQSARIADKTRAIEASRAGIAYANAQLSGSARGDLWRPIDVSPAPAPGAIGYDFYYSQLDKVQGWANRRAQTDPLYRDTTYGKFPDPTQPVGDAPKFLVKVREVPSNTADPDYEAGHIGEIKITSIGLSDDDPNVFHRAIAYKSGRLKSPWASALRSVSNWKFGDNEKNTGVPYATKPQIVNAASTFPANNVEFTVNSLDKPAFSNDNVPFNVVIVKKDSAPSVRGAVVTKVSANGTQLTFARLEKTIGAGETIQKAAAIGIGSTIDLLNTGTPKPYAADLPQPNGILANGSVWLQGQIQLSNLSKSGTRLSISGSLAIDGADTDKKSVLENSGDVGPTNTTDSTSNKVVPSSQNNFPGNLVLTSAAASNGVETTDLVNDGWNKIGAQSLGLDYSSARDVEPFTPAKIDSPHNLARYRALARNSADGVYIDNRDDIERIGTAPMTQQQLVEMLSSPPTVATPPDYSRVGVAALPSATNVSLEQRHLRGWVGPDEFLARGALVEISNDAYPAMGITAPSLRVTLDARSDDNPNGPDSKKVWRKPDGTPDAGVYTKVLPWPTNGTLLAEGNLRIRGNLTTTTAPRSLTVVSMGNIYIEGALSLDNTMAGSLPDPDRKKLMLLAKKNVIVNPTRAVIGRTDVQTIATNTAAITLTGTAAAPKTFVISVANIEAFNQGDFAEITRATIPTPIRGLITIVDTATGKLTISSASSGSIAAATAATPTVVRSPLEKRDAGTGASRREFFSLIDTENAINRRVIAPLTQDVPTNRNRLLFDHVGELRGTATTKEGLKIKAEDFDGAHPRPTDFTALLTNKQPVDASQNLKFAQTDAQSADKILRTYQSFSTPDLKPFSNITPPTPRPLSALVAEITATAESRELPNSEGYRYNATLTNSAFATLPSHALAGVGLRYAPETLFVAPTNSPANNRRQDFNTITVPEGFVIPLATSVEYDLNGSLSNLLPNSQARFTQYIGFDPKPGDSDDALTVDNSFYQTKDAISKSTLDSRVLSLAPSANPNLTLFPQSLVFKRAVALSDAATSNLLPDHYTRAMKLENTSLNDASIKPVMAVMQINAFIYAQEGSWLIIAGDYFRSNPPVRGIADGNGKLTGSYVDFNNNKTADANEFIYDGVGGGLGSQVADLNRNGVADKGEKEAALRFVRYNSAPIQFLGAIVENQTAVVGDVAAVASDTAPIVTGAVQDWTDKWTTYDDTNAINNDVGKPRLFKFISYQYDSSLANGSVGARGLRVPVTDDLIYQQ